MKSLGASRLILPASFQAKFGSCVSGAGDFIWDDNRLLDIAIGAPLYDAGGFGEYDNGAVFIVSGSNFLEEGKVIDLSTNEWDGLLVMGRFESKIGSVIDRVGDVNADGYADLGIGSETGRVGYILFGGEFNRRLIPVGELGASGVEILNTGYSLSSAGDFNGDGFRDVVFGNPASDKVIVKTNDQENEYDIGHITMIFGRKTFPTSIDSLIPSDNLNVKIHPRIAGTDVGKYISGNFDFNVDGYSDFFVVAPKGGKDFEGRTILVMGKEKLDEVDYEFVIDHARYYVRPAGDVNGDGHCDFLVGMEDQSVLLLWGGEHLRGTMDLRKYDPALGVLFRGGRGAQVGYGVGDINGDGLQDFAIALPLDTVGDKTLAGRVIFIFGRMDNWSQHVNLDLLCSGENLDLDYVVVNGTESYSGFGASVAGVGDIQGDGYEDVLVGAPADTLQVRLHNTVGSAYLIHGQSLFLSMQNNHSLLLSRQESSQY